MDHTPNYNCYTNCNIMKFLFFCAAVSVAAAAAGRDYGFASEDTTTTATTEGNISTVDNSDVTTTPKTTTNSKLDLEEMQEDNKGNTVGKGMEKSDEKEKEDPWNKLVDKLMPFLLALVGLCALYGVLCHIHKNMKLWVKNRNNNNNLDVQPAVAVAAAPADDDDTEE